MPQLEQTDTALHNGNAELRKSLWAHNESVTLFGAAFTMHGWDAISHIFDWLASTFSHCEAFTYEVMAADVSGDLAYNVGTEHTTASVCGAPAIDLLRRAHLWVQRQRRDFQHKTALALQQQYDVIYLQDVQVRNLVRNHHLAKSISDASWAAFRTILEGQGSMHMQRALGVR
jgi:ketosteroid isomerase-like protein